jgi:hypothetical protein
MSQRAPLGCRSHRLPLQDLQHGAQARLSLQAGALSRAQVKTRKVLAALITGVSAGQQASQPFYRSAELYRGVPFRLWDFCGDRRRSVKLWGFCGGAPGTRRRPARTCAMLTVRPIPRRAMTHGDESPALKATRSPNICLRRLHRLSVVCAQIRLLCRATAVGGTGRFSRRLAACFKGRSHWHSRDANRALTAEIRCRPGICGRRRGRCPGCRSPTGWNASTKAVPLWMVTASSTRKPLPSGHCMAKQLGMCADDQG